MDLALWIANRDIEKLNKENIRVRFIGSRDGLNKKLIKAIENAEDKTKNNSAGELLLCFNYGGRREIVDACRKLIASKVEPKEIDDKKIEQYLYSNDVPDVDCLVRTSGEKRISNFMLWKSAYAELIFVDEYWPDFNKAKLEEVINEFSNRKRRFGA